MRLRQLVTPTLQEQPLQATFRSIRGVPAPVWSLGLGMLLRSLFLLNALRAPMPGWTPGLDRYGFAAYTIVVGSALCLFGRRVPDWVLQSQVLVLSAATGWLIATAPTPLSVPQNLLTVIAMSVYVGVWFTAPQIILHVGFATAAAVIGIHVRPDHDGSGLAGMWVPVIVMAAIVSFLLYHLMRHMARLASVDPLTGTLNRAGLALIVDRPEAISGLTHPVSIAVMDLDDFKQVNDEQGHAAGDEILRQVGRVLAHDTRRGDLAVRLGGDEFLLILPATDAPEAERIARRIVSALPIPASFGAAPWRRGTPFDQALALADASMYRDKERRRMPGGDIA